MPRRKLSEYRAKSIVLSALDIPYSGWTEDNELNKETRYVVKVDQAVKKRFKNGLVGLDLGVAEVPKWIERAKQKGYESFIIEPYRKHDRSDERYLSLLRDGHGLHLTYSPHGGVDVEEQKETLETTKIDDTTDWRALAQTTALDEKKLKRLVDIFTKNYFTLLEINPYLVNEGQLVPLDIAAEVDDAAMPFVDTWNSDDIRSAPRILSDEERAVTTLNESSPASFSFQILNPDGSLFVLLSGGGASVTVCDEIYSAGLGEQLANYGEYSGNPTTEEAYIYGSAVIRTLLKSKAPKKALFIGGAVANFTDVTKTFVGLVKAIDEYGNQLRKQGVRVVVRRGGPNQATGLSAMGKVLDKYELNAAVYDQKTTIDSAVATLLGEVA